MTSRFAIAALWAAAMLLAPQARGPLAAPEGGGDPAVLERRVKSAFLYKFPGYVEWPSAAFPSAEAPVRIGVVADSALTTELRQLVSGRTSGGRPVEVIPLEYVEELPGVHVLFIGPVGADEMKVWIENTRGTPVLVVTHTPRALSAGSMINFVLAEGRVRFEVNLVAAEQAKLSLSSRLLSVAMSVIDEKP